MNSHDRAVQAEAAYVRVNERLIEAERLLFEFQDWSENFADGYVDTNFGGTLAEDIGYQGLFLEVLAFRSKDPMPRAAAEGEGPAHG